MHNYLFKHKGKHIKINALCWQAAIQLVNDQEDVALEPEGYWRESTYQGRTFTWIQGE